jgi:formylglycine-generating enzyme required for sulfatase activity
MRLKLFVPLIVAAMSNALISAQDKAPLKRFTNCVGMEFVWVPPGTFVMGSPKNELGRYFDERQHKVTITKGFYMGKYTVTQAQWKAVFGDEPSAFKGGKSLPVESVSWDGCQGFIRKLRGIDQNPYRLPTEAEWEYACRAGTKTPFCFGDTISSDQANYDGNYIYGDGKKGISRKKTTAVGSFPPNAWGLHDMHGNVWQFCQDVYAEYPENDVVDPKGPEKGTHRVARGGSYFHDPQCARSASRLQCEPDIESDIVGFRVCFSPR